MEWKIGLICLALFLVVCQALTLSRGGWVGTAGAMLFMAVVLLLKKGFVHKRLVGTLLGAVVVIGLIIMASTPVVQRITTLTQGITLGAMAALVALLIHSYSDGNLQIPANTLLFTALAAAGLRKV